MAKHQLIIENFTPLKVISDINLLAGEAIHAGDIVHMRKNNGMAFKGFSSFADSYSVRTEIYGIACNDASVGMPVRIMLRGVFCGVDFESMAPNVNAGDHITLSATFSDSHMYTDDRRLSYTASGSSNAIGFVLTPSTIDGKLNMATPVIYNGHIVI